MHGIECNNCGRMVIPRLWSYSPFFWGSAAYLKTQHVCTYCGVCMYTTGGGLNPLGKFCIGVILAVPTFFLALGAFGHVTMSDAEREAFARTQIEHQAQLAAAQAKAAKAAAQRKKQPTPTRVTS